MLLAMPTAAEGDAGGVACAAGGVARGAAGVAGDAAQLAGETACQHHQ